MCRVRAVEVPCVLNIAAVKLRFKEFDEAIHECNKVLDIEVSQLGDPLHIYVTKYTAAGGAGLRARVDHQGALQAGPGTQRQAELRPRAQRSDGGPGQAMLCSHWST